MLILLTNDDGIQSPGLQVLAEQIGALGRVVVVAPDRERSAVGHSLTLHAPLRAQQYRPDWWAVDGTPTDCVSLGIHGLLKKMPDLVISGINRGANMGDDLTYSGTVAAAMEATLMGVPAFAMSLDGPEFVADAFQWAARVAAGMALTVREHGLPADTFLNINVPSGKPTGIRLTRQGKRIYEGAVVCKSDPRGNDYYWIGAGELGFQDLDGTDFNALQAGEVSVTPLHLDLTNYAALERLRQWDLAMDFSLPEGTVSDE
ncbi:MAG TPA: 5'/3'-nucleotidase SurE [Desulfobacteraceae bacterium]|nr:5'/3'-nucleotidase SurE [Desulfobacteraceae bacterium]